MARRAAPAARRPESARRGVRRRGRLARDLRSRRARLPAGAGAGDRPLMSYGILLLRLVLGATLAAHGAQKLFGVLGGGGPRGTVGFFARLGFRAPLLMALAAGL